MTRTSVSVCLLATALTVSASSISAQMPYQKFSIDTEGGFAFPLGTYSQVQVLGPHINIWGAYWLTQGVAFRLGGGVSFTRGKGARGEQPTPGVNMWYYLAGVNFELTDPGGAPDAFDFDLAFAAGGTYMVGRSNSDFSANYFTLSVALKLLEEVSPWADIFVGIQWYGVFAEKEATGELDDAFRGTSLIHIVPLTIGFRLRT